VYFEDHFGAEECAGRGVGTSSRKNEVRTAKNEVVERYGKRRKVGGGRESSKSYTQADVLIFGPKPLKELFMNLVSF